MKRTKISYPCFIVVYIDTILEIYFKLQKNSKLL